MTLSLEYPDYGPGRSGNGTVSIASGFRAPNRRFESSGVVSLPIPSQDIATNVVVRRVMLHLPKSSPHSSNDHCPTIAVGLGMFQAHRVPVRDAPSSRPLMAARRPERAIMPNCAYPNCRVPHNVGIVGHGALSARTEERSPINGIRHHAGRQAHPCVYGGWQARRRDGTLLGSCSVPERA